MKLYAIFGNPVEHSISPLLHNYAFEKLGFKGCYTKRLIEQKSGLRETFFGLALKGVNITVPYKEQAFMESDEVLGIAKEIGAVNTWYEKRGKILAYNTDAPGFYESIEEFDFKHPIILGAGGTAKAIAVYLKHKGFEPVVLNRSASRLPYFLEKGIEAYTWEEFKKNRPFDIVINTTSAGLKDDSLPAPKELLEELFKEARYAVDVIYNRLTPFLKLAKEMGLTYKDGTEMLINQGVLAFEIFTDYQYKKEEIRELFKEAAALLH